jgi:hypothetical protein
MFTTDAMDRYIEESARAFLKGQKPLNETITKIASEHGLNRDQISRVVEGANTEVYVQLANQSSDKYVNFEVADTTKIASAVHGIEKQAEIITADYDVPPSEDTLEGSFLDKVASEEVRLDATAVHNQAIKLAGLDEQLTNSLEEVDVRFQQNSEVMYHLVKQAYLAGTSFGDIKTAIQTVYDSPVVAVVLDDCREKLAEEIYPKQIVMDSKNHGSVNSENPIIKQAGLITKDVQEFKTLREKIAEVHAGIMSCIQRFPETKHLLKSAAPITPTGETISAMEKGISKAKKLALVGGVGVLGGIGLEHHMNTYRKQQSAMPMTGVSPQFAR